MHVVEVDPALQEDLNSDDYASSGYENSLSSSIEQYAYENGRRYHTYFGDDKNLQPTDETEQDRLDLHHEIFLILLGGRLHLAPIGKTPQRILDVGTGTGIWAIEMADKYPNAMVFGLDLSPIQPKWVPPNCRFEVDDAERDWTHELDYFDFIHIRNLAQAISDWPKLLSQAYECTAPGGYIELAELETAPHSDDGTLDSATDLLRYFSLLHEGLARMGNLTAVAAETLKSNLENAGFVDVTVTTRKHPLAPWPKDPKMKHAGALALLSCQTGFHAYGIAIFTRVLGIDPVEADRICRAAIAQNGSRSHHIYTYYHVLHARKPLA